MKYMVHSILFSLMISMAVFGNIAHAQSKKTPEQKRQDFERIRQKIDREVEQVLREQARREAEAKARREAEANFAWDVSTSAYRERQREAQEALEARQRRQQPSIPLVLEVTPPPQLQPHSQPQPQTPYRRPSPVVVAPPPPEPMAPLRAITQEISEREGSLRIMNKMICEPSQKSICRQICAADACEWPEPLCRDCFGTGSEVMRDVFIRLSPTYRATKPIDDVGLIERLLARSIVLVSQSSPYDFFNSSQDPGISPHLMTMCGSTNGFVGVLLDDDGRPSQALLAICSSQEGIRAALIERSDATTDPVLEPIQLKLTHGLVENRKP